MMFRPCVMPARLWRTAAAKQELLALYYASKIKR
jgi:hypothetical protein